MPFFATGNQYSQDGSWLPGLAEPAYLSTVGESPTYSSD